MGKAIVIDPVKAPSGAIVEADRRYFNKGKWRCPKSPTGAHVSTDEIKRGFLVCKYCGQEQPLPHIEEVDEWLKW